MNKVSIIKSGNQYNGVIYVKAPEEIGEETQFEFLKTFTSDVPPANNKAEFIKTFFAEIMANAVNNKVIGFMVKQFKNDTTYVIYNTQVALRGGIIDLPTFNIQEVQIMI